MRGYKGKPKPLRVGKTNNPNLMKAEISVKIGKVTFKIIIKR